MLLFGCISSVVGQGPIIEVWYGDEQSFGARGNPQRWINIMGNVSDPDGLDSLVYSLNNGTEKLLTIGPDGRRLENTGDFNVDIHVSLLNEGENSVLLRAKDNLGNESSKTVAVFYTGGSVWSRNYNIAWDTVTALSNVVQGVDGLWQLTANGVRTIETGYDRLLALGDSTWMDYEIEVELTPHDFKGPIGSTGGAWYGLGVILRWKGHTDSPSYVAGWQPKTGYLPMGDIAWLNWHKGDPTDNNISFFNGEKFSGIQPELGKTYIFKARVETQSNGNRYRAKVWEKGTSEPDTFQIENVRTQGLTQGCLLLVAHYIDATFGDLSVTPLFVPAPEFTHSSTENNYREITFDATSSTIEQGSIVSYQWDFGDGNLGEGQTVKHQFAEDSTYLVELLITSDRGSEAKLIKNVTIEEFPNPATFISDDFSTQQLDLSRWRYSSPLGDGNYGITTWEGESALEINVPAGSTHEIWTGINTPIALYQNSSNTDFEIIVKFLSDIKQAYQEQGLLIRQDSTNLIRTDFFFDGGFKRFFVASFKNGSPNLHNHSTALVDSINGMFLKVKRQGDQWAIDYSDNGVDWIKGVDFNLSLEVSEVGVFGGNAGDNPAHTVLVDYFFNGASPIEPEDGNVISDVADAEISPRLVVYPNPSPQFTRIRYLQQRPGYTEVLISDAMGRTVQRLSASFLQSGWHEWVWRHDSYSNGMYVVQIRQGNGTHESYQARKIIVAK